MLDGFFGGKDPWHQAALKTLGTIYENGPVKGTQMAAAALADLIATHQWLSLIAGAVAGIYIYRKHKLGAGLARVNVGVSNFLGSVGFQANIGGKGEAVTMPMVSDQIRDMRGGHVTLDGVNTKLQDIRGNHHVTLASIKQAIEAGKGNDGHSLDTLYKLLQTIESKIVSLRSLVSDEARNDQERAARNLTTLEGRFDKVDAGVRKSNESHAEAAKSLGGLGDKLATAVDTSSKRHEAVMGEFKASTGLLTSFGEALKGMVSWQKTVDTRLDSFANGEGVKVKM